MSTYYTNNNTELQHSYSVQAIMRCGRAHTTRARRVAVTRYVHHKRKKKKGKSEKEKEQSQTHHTHGGPYTPTAPTPAGQLGAIGLP